MLQENLAEPVLPDIEPLDRDDPATKHLNNETPQKRIEYTKAKSDPVVKPRSHLSEQCEKRILEKMTKEIKPLDIGRRRKLAQMYTFRKYDILTQNGLKGVDSVKKEVLQLNRINGDDMDNKFKRVEPKDTKVNLRVSDRGDNAKREDLKLKRMSTSTQESTTALYMINDRGDSPVKIQKIEKCGEKGEDVSSGDRIDKLDVNKLKKDPIPINGRIKKCNHRMRKNDDGAGKIERKVLEKTKLEVKPLDLSRRQLLAQRYTFRRPVNDVPMPSEKIDVLQTRELDNSAIIIQRTLKKDLTEDSISTDKYSEKISICTSFCTEKIEKEVEKECKETEKKLKKDKMKKDESKLIIKTVKSKADSSKVYKAVTFADHKNKLTSIKVKIPRKPFSPDNSISPETESLRTDSSVKEKPKLRKKKRIRSPDLSPRDVVPVTTEVAKWVPFSFDKHTQPYYEAWVDTTLTAVSRHNSIGFDEKELLERVKRAIGTPLHEADDLSSETFTGTIRVKRKTKS